MKKLISVVLFALAIVTAAFAQSGNTRQQAIPFDWEGVHKQKGRGVDVMTKWYNVDLTRVLNQTDPTLALYVTNMSETQTAHIAAAVYVGTSNTSLGDYDFDLEPGQFRIMSRNVSILKTMNHNSVYIMMQVSNTTDTVALSAKAVETRRIETTCQQSTQLHVGDPEHTEATGALKWFNFSLNNYKSGYDLHIHVRNTSASPSTIETSFSYDCPSTGTTDRSDVVAAGSSTTVTLPVAVLEAISETRAYFSVKATGSYGIEIEAEEKVIVPEPVIPDTVPYDWSAVDGMVLPAEEIWYSVACDSLTDDLLVPLVRLHAPSASGANITSKLAYIRNHGGSDEFIVLAEYDWSFARENNSFYLDVNELMALYSSLQGGRVFYGITSDVAGVTFKFLLNSIVTNTDCENASSIPLADLAAGYDINAGHETDFSAWYTFNAAGWLGDEGHNGKDLRLQVVNMEDHAVTVYAMPASCVQQDINRAELERVVLAASGEDGDAAGYTIHRHYLEGQKDGIKFYFETNGAVQLFSNMVAAGAYSAGSTPGGASPTNDAAVVDFDWRYGHNQRSVNQSDTVVWYKVSKDTLNGTTVSPKLYVVNNSAADATVEVQYVFALPVTGALQAPITFNLAAGRDTLYTMPRGVLDNFRYDDFYLRVRSDAPAPGIYIQLQLPSDNQYANRMCDAALDFNWNNGNIQPADTTLWYMIDLAMPKADHSTIKLHIDNQSASEAHVTANLALSCPYTSYAETYNATIAPGATRPSLGSTQGNLSYAMYGALDTVWVRLTTDQKVRLWAELVPDEFGDTIRACADAPEFEFDHVYTITEDSTWFYFITDTFKSETFAPLTWVPQITIKNPLGHSVDIKSIGAFHCPITETPIEGTRSVAAGGEMVRAVERSFVDGYVNQSDTFFVCIITEAGVQFSATMIDPNKGTDCFHAIDLKLCPDSNLQVGGSMWYKINIDEIRGKEVNAVIKNESGVTQTVNAAIYLNCDSDPLEQTSRTSAAYTSTEREIGALISGMRYHEAFLRVSCTDSLSIKLCLGEDLPQMEDSIHLCTDTTINLIKAEPNIWYHQEAADTMWYFVDIVGMDTLFRDASDDAVLRIKTDCGTAKIVANQWWECETKEKPTEKGQTVTEPYERRISYEMVHAIQDSASYIMLTADQCFDFMIELETKKGKTCDKAIEFDWDYCNTHPAGKSLWYHINVDTLLNNPDKDLSLDIENLEDAVVTAKVDSIRLTCGEKPIMEIGNRTLDPGEVKHQFVDNTLLQDFNIGNTGIYMKVTADGQIRICPTLVPALEDSVVLDTIYYAVCFGGDFLDPFFPDKPDSVDVHNHTVFGIEESFTLTDTVSFRYDGTFHGDSVRYYEVHVVTDPLFAQPVDSAYLPALVLEAGKKINQDVRDAVFAQLLDSMKAQPFVSVIDSVESKAYINSTFSVADTYVYFEQGVWDDVAQKYGSFTALTDDYTSPFANEDNNGEMGLRITYVDTCGIVLQDTLVLSFTDNTYETVRSYTDTVCAGYSFTNPVTSNTYTINVDTAVIDTVVYVDAINDIRTDSIVTYNFYVFTHQMSALAAADYPVMQAGKGLEYVDAETVLRANFAADNDYAPAVTSVTWKYSESADKAADTYVSAETLSSTDAGQVWVAYKLLTDCGDELYDTVQIAATEADTLQGLVNAHICYGDSLQGRDGRWHVANVAEQTWNDTVHNKMKAGVLDQQFDSVYIYTLTTLMPSDSTPSWDLCEGHVDTMFFNTHITGLAPGSYEFKDTLRTFEHCDSIWGVVNITVHATVHTEDSVSLCKLETYQWGWPELRTFSWANKGDYYVTDTFPAVFGCDSVVRMKFHVEVNDTMEMTRVICGGTAFSEYPFLTENYTVGGNYTKTVHTNNTCDSVYILHLIVQSYTREVHPETLCEGETSQYTHKRYDHFGHYQDSTMYKYSVTGCDSLGVIYDITVYKKFAYDSIAEICQGETYSFNGQVYNAPGEYTESRYSVNGCDSVITLHLTVNPTYEIPENAVICDNESYTWLGHKNNIQYSGLTPGEYVYYDSLQTMKGCDSVYVLTLKVNPSYAIDVYDTICRGTSIDLGGNGGYTVINLTGNYVERRTTVATNCDSVLTHHVVVRSLPQLPAAEDVMGQMQVVCGETLNFAKVGHNADSLIAAYFAEDIVLYPEHAHYAYHKWQIYNNATQTWDDRSSTNELYYDTDVPVVIRYVVYTECGDEMASAPFTISVEPPSTDNTYEHVVMPVIVKYEGWLIILDKKTAEARLAAAGINVPLTDPSVEITWWLQTGAEPAPIGKNGLPDNTIDREVTTLGGDIEFNPNNPFYLTSRTGAIPSGAYYAIARIEGVAMGSPCQIAIRTETVQCVTNTPAANNNAPVQGEGSGEGGYNHHFRVLAELAPAIVAPGETITIFNLNPEVTSKVEIYDIMGGRIDAFEVTGQESVRYSTSTSHTGCFMMLVTSEEGGTALKYIVR